jgi:hypothetical protein
VPIGAGLSYVNDAITETQKTKKMSFLSF